MYGLFIRLSACDVKLSFNCGMIDRYHHRFCRVGAGNGQHWPIRQLDHLFKLVAAYQNIPISSKVCYCFFLFFTAHSLIFKNKVLYTTDLTQWGRDKMAAIFQTTFSNAFSWIKIYEFRLKFHWILFLRVQLTILQHWFRYGSALTLWQAIIWTNGGEITDTYIRHPASMI